MQVYSTKYYVVFLDVKCFGYQQMDKNVKILGIVLLELVIWTFEGRCAINLYTSNAAYPFLSGSMRILTAAQTCVFSYDMSL